MKRQLTKQLNQWRCQSERKPLLLSGVRQCGKTYLLKSFGEKHFKNVHYINFEEDPNASILFDGSLKPELLLKSIAFYLHEPIDSKQDLIIFDEVQSCPNALTSLKYFCEKLPEQAICASGSLLGVHLAPVSFPVGKVDMLTLHPMTFIEFIEAIDDQQSLDFLTTIKPNTEIPEVIHKHLLERLKWYFVVGGMPEAVSTFCKLKDDIYVAMTSVRKKQLELMKAYYADIAKHAGKANAMHIDRIWHSVPIQLAKNHDGSSKRFQFKGVIPGIDRYSRMANAMHWLEKASLIIKVPIIDHAEIPLKAYTKEAFFKLYMFDIGMLGAMIGLSPETLLQPDNRKYQGYFVENFVAQAFTASDIEELYCWQKHKKEVGFIRDIRGDIIPIEVKAGKNTRSKSLQIFTEKYHPPYRCIISAKTLRIGTGRNALHHYPLYLATQFPIT